MAVRVISGTILNRGQRLTDDFLYFVDIANATADNFRACLSSRTLRMLFVKES